MPFSRREILRAGVLLPTGLLLPPNAFVRASDAPATLDGEDVILAHLSDAHVLAGHSSAVDELRGLLTKVKAISPALLIDTGDITEDNLTASYQLYLQAYMDVGGFSVPPDYGPGLPLYVVAGNHEVCGLLGYGYQENLGAVSYKHSLAVGNYRLVGTSGNADWAPDAWPATFLNNQMAKSCADGKPIVFFHHFCPHGWALRTQANLDVSAAGWATIDTLAQKYPVLGYLCGHCHYDKTEIEPPGYFVHAVERVTNGALSLHALADGHMNSNHVLGAHTFVVITRPAQYMQGLDHEGVAASLGHTRTLAKETLVRAYVRVDEGEIARVAYKLDGGADVLMQRLGSTSYWEAELDARSLSGEHTLSVTAIPALGAWARATHEITCCFAAHVPARIAPGCAATSITLSLSAGWNLISVPFEPLAPAPLDVLSPIAGQYTELLAFSNADAASPWERFSPSAPAFVNDLTVLVPQRGYWLRMTSPAALTLLGNPPDSASVTLQAGWNLVGYPSQTPKTVVAALEGVAEYVDCVYAYDAADPNAPWRLYDPGATPTVDEIVTLYPGSGYWIHATAECVWNVI